MMELVPLRVAAPPGTRTTFSCSYRSNERLSIEFEALNARDTASLRVFSKRSVMTAAAAAERSGRQQYSWGANRRWTLVLEARHRMVACNLRNARGLVVGQLTAVIETGSSPCVESVAITAPLSR